MPNWCYNHTIFFGDVNQLRKFKADLEDAISEKPTKFKPVENSWNNLWLGNIFLAAGYSEEEVKDSDKIKCRGGIIDYDINDDSDSAVELYYESAWSPITESLDKMLKEKYPGLRQVTLAEEPNYQLYINTDVKGLYFSKKYLIDCCYINDDGDEEYYNESFNTEKSFVKKINEIYHKDFTSYEEVENALEEISEEHNDDEEFLTIAEYTN